MVTENLILRVANMLSFDVSLEEIREKLLGQGMSEYDIFLAVQAGKTYNVIDQRIYVEE